MQHMKQCIRRFAILLAGLVLAMSGSSAAAVDEALTPAEWYRLAGYMVEQGQFFEAMLCYQNAGDQPGAAEKAHIIRQAYEGALSVGPYEIAVLYRDGTVLYDSAFSNSLEGWYRLTAVAIHENYAIGLTEDGNVHLCWWIRRGLETDLPYGGDIIWKNIAAIAAGHKHIAGLRRDGTVVAAGSNSSGQCNVETWTDMIDVAAGAFHTVGLRRDGTVAAVGKNTRGQCEVDGWTDIIAITASETTTIGLRRDGTVVAAGSDSYGQCGVDGWTDIVDIAAGPSHTLGLRRDGTVVAVGSNNDGLLEVDGWTDIVAVAAGNCHSVGMRRDGTLHLVCSVAHKLTDWITYNDVGPNTHALRRLLEE